MIPAGRSLFFVLGSLAAPHPARSLVHSRSCLWGANVGLPLLFLRLFKAAAVVVDTRHGAWHTVCHWPQGRARDRENLGQGPGKTARMYIPSGASHVPYGLPRGPWEPRKGNFMFTPGNDSERASRLREQPCKGPEHAPHRTPSWSSSHMAQAEGASSPASTPFARHLPGSRKKAPGFFLETLWRMEKQPQGLLEGVED
ncbi:uncharacterized protein LOC110261077 isoform X1 [Sus scrofa]|uniref:uncharacterized protein LOC110261077 isoform X1 n=1 Tax=Sus scrofa TaxID=9823 RepID=UPI000A2B68D5|nr:uncharacterized protein LOC110261077 isoform X1 [Sus scrofa]XP_020950795.1 uncharacterized protein LOC110261077 isoform X1 [Sus scrofa]